MILDVRMYRGKDYYIRAFLRRCWFATWRQRSGTGRFDYWRWHGIANLWIVDLKEYVCIWETEDGQIAAVLNPRARATLFQIHPAARRDSRCMLDEAEQRLPARAGIMGGGA
jgi:hypothetical protein